MSIYPVSSAGLRFYEFSPKKAAHEVKTRIIPTFQMRKQRSSRHSDLPKATQLLKL